MLSIRDLLSKIKERPGVYLGDPSVIRLWMFVLGWFEGVGAAGAQVSDGDLLNDFSAYVQKKHGIETSHGWASIIEFMGGGGRDSFDLFYRDFEDYCSHRDSSSRKD